MRYARMLPASAPGFAILISVLGGASGSIDDLAEGAAFSIAALQFLHFVFVYAFLYLVLSKHRVVESNIAVVLRTVDGYAATVFAFAGLYYATTLVLPPGRRVAAWSDGMSSDHRDAYMSILYYAATLLYSKPSGSPFPTHWALLAISILQFVVFGTVLLGVFNEKVASFAERERGGGARAEPPGAAPRRPTYVVPDVSAPIDIFRARGRSSEILLL